MVVFFREQIPRRFHTMKNVPFRVARIASALLLWLAFGLIRTTHAIGPDPSDDWRSAHSAHFTIHFEDAHRAYAQKALEIAEKVYAPVTKALGWEPYESTHMALLANIDFANGYATPLPFNRMGIILTPPDFSDDLVRGDWLELVIHHEFTHIVHLDKGSGAPGGLRNVFGRFPWLYPNIFQARWLVEGLATYSESAPELGIGRLRGPYFEAWMRGERKRGFRSLRELNADGRNPPLFDAYLYGAYFYDFLARRYGKESVRKLLDSYSDNLLPFRVHSAPYEVTGKMMDELYAEFIEDLAKEIDTRAAPILRQPEVVGQPVGSPMREIWAVAAGKGTHSGALYAVTDDGITQPRLQRYAPDGSVRTLTPSRFGTRIDVRADGTVLASQIEICGGYDAYFDLYRIDASGAGLLGAQRLTHCGRYFRAVWGQANDTIYALKHAPGKQHLVRLDEHGGKEQVLLSGTDAVQWIDLAASPDGRRLALIGKHATGFALYEFDIATQTLRVRHVDRSFKHSPHYQADSVYFLSDTDNVFNVWRLTPTGDLERVTHTHTAVKAFGGVDDHGQLALALLERGQVRIHQLHHATSVQSAQANAVMPSSTDAAPSALPALTTAVAMEGETSYSALSTLVPRSWFPILFTDRSTYGLGLTTFGADALDWHRYTLTPVFEFTQREPLGLFEYAYHGLHHFTLDRSLAVTRWRAEDKRDKATEYERSLQAQWVSRAWLVRWDYRLNAGIGAAIEHKDRVTIDGPTRELDDERIAAALLEYESLKSNIYSEGLSQGLRARLLYETYRPFKSGTRFDGDVLRLDLQGYFPIGKSVLALRGIETHARDATENFELGGSFSELAAEAPRLNERRLALRGYDRGISALRGRNARLGTVELRFPLVDIDRHAMVPPIGINRLSAAVFYDIGRVSGNGATGHYRQGVGFEILGEIKLGYLFTLPVRAGVAYGLNDFGDTQVYIQVGRSF